MVLGQLDIHVQKDEAGHLLHKIWKSNWKWIKNLNVRTKIMKLLNLNINLHDHVFGNKFLEITSKNTNSKRKK